MSFQCRYCGKNLKTKKSRDRHEKETCPDRPKKEPGEVVEEVVEGKKLEIKKPEAKDKDPTAGAGYHHNDCGGSLKRGETPCPTCGKEVDWGALNGET